MGTFDLTISELPHHNLHLPILDQKSKMAPIIAHYKNNFPHDFEPLEVETNTVEDAPMSRTHQYRKVMKPLLERKRRARINKCLDDLKDLMVFALQSEGESITKLEKADVLELTVRHLQKLKRQQQLQANPSLDMDRYRAGYTACAAEVSRFMASVPGVNVVMGTRLMGHLGSSISGMEATTQTQQQMPIAPTSSHHHFRSAAPMSPSSSSDCGYSSGRDSNSPLSVGSPSPAPPKTEAVWRPF